MKDVCPSATLSSALSINASIAGLAAQGKRRARVAVFAGCISQVSFAALHEATIRVLTTNGCEVVVPDGQLCCGALAAHGGVRDVARQLARTNLDVFLREEFDAVITNAAGCGSTLKEYDQLFEPADPAHEKAHEFRGKMRDVTEFLDALGLTAPLREIRMRVTYQDSCHLAHGQKIREAPRRLIRAIPGIELTEMRLSDNCCGSAGGYNLTQTQTSLGLLAEENDVPGVNGMAMVRIALVRPVLPEISVTKAFATQLFFDCGNVHRDDAFLPGKSDDPRGSLRRHKHPRGDLRHQPPRGNPLRFDA